jgi:hypothetical protein
MTEKDTGGAVLIVAGIGGIAYGINYMNSITSQIGSRFGVSDSTGLIFIGGGVAVGLIGLNLVISQNREQRGQEATPSFRCPKCKTPVGPDPKKCPGCGGLFKAGIEAGLTEGVTKKCPECAEEVKADARKCRFCGYAFPTE